ncbi:MAG: hypothetical protein HYR94_11815, partial [Chloroflexi bacterium]|nr:hypothetical protein [Chloroflexota bacterium]
MAQTTGNPESNRAHLEVLAQGNDLAQSVLARANWPKIALSSWVQRSWQARPTQAGQQRQTAFSEQHTQALVNRIFRQVETSRVWHPDVGPIAPDTFERFANDIVERHQPVSNKYLVQTGEENPEEGDELTLAPGRPVGIGVGLSRKSSKAQPATLPPSLTSPQPAIPASLPAMQRSPAQPVRPNPSLAASTPSRPARPIQRRRNVRIFSQVQEMTPGSKTWAEIKPEPIAGAEVDLLPPELGETRDQEAEAGEAEHVSPLEGTEAGDMPLAPAEASPLSVQRMAELTSAAAAEPHPLPDRPTEFSPPSKPQAQKAEPDSPQAIEDVSSRQAKPAGPPQAQRQAEQANLPQHPAEKPAAQPTLTPEPAEPTLTPRVFEELPVVQRRLEDVSSSPASSLHEERPLVSQQKVGPSSREAKPTKAPVSRE